MSLSLLHTLSHTGGRAPWQPQDTTGTHGEGERETDGWTDRQTDIQTDRHSDIWTDRQKSNVFIKLLL